MSGKEEGEEFGREWTPSLFLCQLGVAGGSRQAFSLPPARTLPAQGLQERVPPNELMSLIWQPALLRGVPRLWRAVGHVEFSVLT